MLMNLEEMVFGSNFVGKVDDSMLSKCLDREQKEVELFCSKIWDINYCSLSCKMLDIIFDMVLVVGMEVVLMSSNNQGKKEYKLFCSERDKVIWG